MSNQNTESEQLDKFINETSEDAPDLDKTPAPEDDTVSEDDDTVSDDTDDTDAEDDKEDDAEDDAEDDKEDDKEDGAEGDDEKDEPKRKKSVQDRIDAVTKKRREAERSVQAKEAENAELRARLAALENKSKETLTEPETSASVGPNVDDYEFGELDSKYIADLVEFKTNEGIAKANEAMNKERQEQAASQRQNELAQKVEESINAGITKYDDFESVVLEGSLKDMDGLPKETAELLVTSDHAADLLYHFGKNPETAESLLTKTPFEQAVAIGRLEAKFVKASPDPEPSKPKPTKAAPPPKRSRGGGANKVSVSADTDDFAAFDKKYS